MKISSNQTFYSPAGPTIDVSSDNDNIQNSSFTDNITAFCEKIRSLTEEETRLETEIQSINKENIQFYKNINPSNTYVFEPRFLDENLENIKKLTQDRESSIKYPDSIKKNLDYQKIIAEYLNLHKEFSALEELLEIERIRKYEIKREIKTAIKNIKTEGEKINQTQQELVKKTKKIREILQENKTLSNVELSPKQTRYTKNCDKLEKCNKKTKTLIVEKKQKESILEEQKNTLSSLSYKKNLIQSELETLKNKISEIQNELNNRQSDFEDAASKFLDEANLREKSQLSLARIRENEQKLDSLNTTLKRICNQLKDHNNSLNVAREALEQLKKSTTEKNTPLCNPQGTEESEALIPKKNKAEKAALSLWKKFFCCF